jgi:hypothetical protein
MQTLLPSKFHERVAGGYRAADLAGSAPATVSAPTLQRFAQSCTVRWIS